jgi:hypothetical protein
VPFWQILILIIGGIITAAMVGGFEGVMGMLAMFFSAFMLYYFRTGVLILGAAGKVHGLFSGIPFISSMAEPDPLQVIVTQKESEEVIALIQSERMKKKRIASAGII